MKSNLMGTLEISNNVKYNNNVKLNRVLGRYLLVFFLCID